MGILCVVRHFCDDGDEVITRIDVVGLAGGKQGADDGHVLCRLVVSTEEVILSSEGDRADGIFCQIVVNEQSAVFEIMHHVVPSGVGVGDGLAYL